MTSSSVLLARPEEKITKEAILPNLEFWHYRSVFYTDFFCAGYIPVEFAGDAKPAGVTIDNVEWLFSLRAFVELVEDIETQTGWSYTGDPCLLLANAYFDGRKAHLDFKRSISERERASTATSTPTSKSTSSQTVY